MKVDKLNHHIKLNADDRGIKFQTKFEEMIHSIELSINDTLFIYKDNLMIRIISSEDGKIFNVYSNRQMSISIEETDIPLVKFSKW